MVGRSILKFLCVLALGTLAVPAAAAPPTLIPREVLFGNPTKGSPRISPDGTLLAYLAPSKDGGPGRVAEDPREDGWELQARS
jgi:hypothetical protein